MTGKSFEELRNRNNIKRADFARYARLNYQTVFNWERYKSPPEYGVQLLRSYIDKVKARQAAEAKKNSAV